MPLITHSTYSSPALMKNGHVQTIFQTLFRRSPQISYTRERIPTPDGDFLDLDWSARGSRDLIIIFHGLEGSTSATYMQSMVRSGNLSGFDTVACNLRGCSGELNHTVRAYHSGATEDLDTILKHIVSTRLYHHLFLIGFSLGGNLVLKYLGEDRFEHPEIVCGGAAVSVPCDLEGASRRLHHFQNRMYATRFLHRLKQKLIEKSETFPETLDRDRIRNIRTLWEFDDLYTAPVHGFRDAKDYYRQCSANNFLKTIQHPTLIINARNDPLLSSSCYPVEEARENPVLFLETPQSGGHVGFITFREDRRYWYEIRICEFFRSILQEI